MKKEENNIESKPKLVVEAATTTEQAATTEQIADVKEQAADDKEQTADDKEQTASEGLTLKQVIEKRATEDESPRSRSQSLKEVLLFGDLFNREVIRNQIWLILLVTFFTIIYISNRYSCQKDLIEIDQLQKELQEAKYKSLSVSSQLTEKCRESHVLEQLKNEEGCELKIANQPPYIIYIPQ